MVDFGPIFHDVGEAQSTSIDYNNGTITTATMSVTGSGSWNLYLTADGGSHWESCSNGVAHTFTNTGTDLRWKMSGSGTITKIIVNNYH